MLVLEVCQRTMHSVACNTSLISIVRQVLSVLYHFKCFLSVCSCILSGHVSCSRKIYLKKLSYICTCIICKNLEFIKAQFSTIKLYF